ncbi:MAG: alkaline phosphatase family protein [Bacteroidaceae bacterium]|nr:alkaline phosphatase family protein [Bacteroidaceae bacterium]
MRFKYCLIALLCCASPLFAQRGRTAPKLYVSIVVDQLRTDFLYEFEELYCEGGFKRLLSGGKVYDNVYYAFDNVDRATSVATLSTGTNPYVSGIVAERWLDRNTLRVVNCVEDKNCKGVYSNEALSPASLKSITITDEIKRSTRGKAIVCSIAPDGDAAVLAGGHAADVVLWKNNMAGYWSSSSYYGLYPSWAADMNKAVQGKPRKWEPMFRTDKYNNFGDKAPSPFSYSFDGKKNMISYKTSACINDEVNEMAIAFLDNSDVGKDDIVDCLALTYYAGNYDGAPMSHRPIEVQDIYARLDRNLAWLFTELDTRYGLGNVVVSLSSTGYVMESGDEDGSYRLPSGTLYSERVQTLLNIYLSAKFGKGDYVEGVYGTQLFLDNKLIERMNLDKMSVVSQAVEFLKSLDGVEDVFTIYRLGGMLSPELQFAKNGYNPVGSGDLWLRLMPGWRLVEDELLVSRQLYRSPIMFPVIIYGAGVGHSVDEKLTPANILATEMARILRVRRPNDNCLRLIE